MGLGILAVLAAAVLAAMSHVQNRADRIEATASMRSMGAAVLAATSDRNGVLPGPLWPGQMAVFDANRSGRLVVELADYLNLSDRGEPYLVRQFLTPTLLRSGIPPETIRLYVMNMNVPVEGQTINPWGSLADPPPQEPINLAALSGIQGEPLLTEAYRGHPDVAGAPWRDSTPATPPHGEPALSLFFDGSVRVP